MNFCQHLLFTLLIISVAKVCSSQPLPASSPDASVLWNALCLQNNRVRESCLQSAHTKDILNALLFSLNPPVRMSDDSSSVNSEKVATPEKRRRDEMSGFYSNW